MNAEALLKDAQKTIAKLEAKNRAWEVKYQALEEKYDLAIYKRFCKSSEVLDKGQLLLFLESLEAELEDDTEEETEIEVSSYKKKSGGKRKPLDDKLPRKEILVDIPEEEKVCACGCQLVRIGEETSEKLQVIPERIFVEKTIRPQYACRNCEGSGDEDKPAVRIAPVPPTIIPKSIVTPGLLAFILVNKYVDHLPFYRQEKRFERIGIYISRQNMSKWQQKAYEKLGPLFELLLKYLKSGPVLQMDETEVQVLGEKDRRNDQKSRMWLARGGPPGKTVISYEYKETRKSEHIHKYLDGFEGYLQTDGYSGYVTAARNFPKVTLVGCFAHARRKFFEASKAKKPGSAAQGLSFIQKLYRIESVLRNKNLSAQDFMMERKAQAAPVLEKFKKWMDTKVDQVPPGTGVGPALHYTLGQWEKLTAYLESPYLTPDNNGAENAIRPFVIGRKNWLFAGSPKGAESSCGIYSLIETAKQNNIDPFGYLNLVFEKAPVASTERDWERLLPWNISS